MKHLLFGAAFFLFSGEAAALTLERPPTSLGLDPFYAKYLDCDGIPIVSSEATADVALIKACAIANQMLRARPDLRARMIKLGARIAVMGQFELTTQIPEFRSYSSRYDVETRGLGAVPGQPVTLVAEENLLCLSTDRYGADNVFIHELGHSIFNLALRGSGDFLALLVAWAYNNSLSVDRWAGTFAMRNVDEYWAELTQVWFEANAFPGHLHGEIDTRVELKKYDSAMYEILRTIYPDDAWRFRCE